MIITQELPDTIRSVKPQNIFQNDLASKVFTKLSKWITSRSITIQQFWDSSAMYVPFSKLQHFFIKSGFQITRQQHKQLRKLFGSSAVIHIKTFYEMIQDWKQNPSLLIQYLGKKVINTVNKHKKVRPYSSMPAMGRERPPSPQQKKKKDSKKVTVLNTSLDHLRQYHQKQQQIQRLLSLTIKRGKNQYQNQMLIKMGQANQMYKQLGQKITFRAYKKAQGDLVVRQFNLDDFVAQKNLEQFKRSYNMIKKRHSNVNQVKRWQVLSISKKTPPGLNITDFPYNQADCVPKKNIKKKQRQEQLRKVLNQTTRLTQILKSQLQILKSKGICPKQ